MNELWMEKILLSMGSEESERFRSLHALAAEGGFIVFVREDRSFRIFERSKNGAGDISFLEDNPEVWMSVFDQGSLKLPETMAARNFSKWIAVDRVENPRFLVVIEVPSHFDGSFGPLLRFALVNDESVLKSRGKNNRYLPVWLKEDLERMESLSSPLLVVSEHGSGSGNLIHALVRRKFVSPESAYFFSPGRLSEAVQLRELFGDSAGVRLGDTSSRIPVLEREIRCVVVNEAGFLSLEVQKRLAHLLQEKKIIFWVFETNMNLSAMVEEGRFLKELADLMDAGRVVIPPLRHHRSYLVKEAEKILVEMKKEYGRQVILDPSAENAIMEYDWPGNWKQFTDVLESSYFMCKNEFLKAADLHFNNEVDAEDWGDLNLRRRTEDLERSLILRAYSMHGGNQVHMSRSLGISRGSLQYKMHKYQLSE